MSDPFGLVNKSYVNAAEGGYKRAVDLSRGERFMIKHGPKLKLKGTGDAKGRHALQAQMDQNGMTESPYRPNARKGDVEIVHKPKDSSKVAQAFPSGRGGGRVHLHGNLNARTTREALKHESAHLVPKRNPHSSIERIYGGGDQGYKAGKEEGRADFHTSDEGQSSAYRGYGKAKGESHLARFDEGYEEVKGKMRAARRKKLGDKYVEPKGKSPYGPPSRAKKLGIFVTNHPEAVSSAMLGVSGAGLAIKNARDQSPKGRRRQRLKLKKPA